MIKVEPLIGSSQGLEECVHNDVGTWNPIAGALGPAATRGRHQQARDTRPHFDQCCRNVRRVHCHGIDGSHIHVTKLYGQTPESASIGTSLTANERSGHHRTLRRNPYLNFQCCECHSASQGILSCSETDASSITDLGRIGPWTSAIKGFVIRIASPRWQELANTAVLAPSNSLRHPG